MENEEISFFILYFCNILHKKIKFDMSYGCVFIIKDWKIKKMEKFCLLDDYTRSFFISPISFEDGSNWRSWHVYENCSNKISYIITLIFCFHRGKNRKFCFSDCYVGNFTTSPIFVRDGSNLRFWHVNYKNKICCIVVFCFFDEYPGTFILVWFFLRIAQIDCLRM